MFILIWSDRFDDYLSWTQYVHVVILIFLVNIFPTDIRINDFVASIVGATAVLLILSYFLRWSWQQDRAMSSYFDDFLSRNASYLVA